MIAYLTTSFGALSHTFIRREVEALKRIGVDIELYGIRPEQSEHLTKNELELCKKTHFLYPVNLFEILKFNFYFLVFHPKRYFQTLRASIFNSEPRVVSRAKLIYHFILSPCIARRLEEQNIDHIHAHFTNVAATFAMYTSLLTGISYSLTVHSAGEYGLSSVHALKEKLKNSRFLCSISKYNIEYFDDIYPCKEKTYLVRCGIPISEYTSKKIYSDFGKSEPLKLISVGRFDEKKGFKYLIEACKYLHESEVSFNLLLIGSGDLFNSIKGQISNYGISDKITLTGSRSQEEIKKALLENDIFIVPSVTASSGEKEGIPVVIMEAMIMGIPVIASNHSGIPELIIDKETGLLTEEKNATDICKKIEMLTSDISLREKCVEGAKQMIINEFDVDKIAKIKKEIFDKEIEG